MAHACLCFLFFFSLQYHPILYFRLVREVTIIEFFSHVRFSWTLLRA
jgi:hypothetical protein